MSNQNDHTFLDILVIDDDPHLLRSIGRFLNGQNYHVTLVETATKGLDVLRSQSFDIVITDVRLPDGDGFDVLNEVQRVAQDDDLNLAEMERRMIVEAMRRAGGKKVDAAQLLGISRNALSRRMTQHGIK